MLKKTSAFAWRKKPRKNRCALAARFVDGRATCRCRVGRNREPCRCGCGNRRSPCEHCVPPARRRPRCRRCRYGARVHGKRCMVPVPLVADELPRRDRTWWAAYDGQKARWLLRWMDRRWPGANSENRYRPNVSPPRHCCRAHCARRSDARNLGATEMTLEVRESNGRPGVRRKLG